MRNIDLERLGVAAFALRKDAQGSLRFDQVNGLYCETTGISKASVLGRRLEEIDHPWTSARMASSFRRCLDTAMLVEREDLMDGPLGRLWWRTTLAPVFDRRRSVSGLLGTTVDVTTSKEVEFDLYHAAFVDLLTGAGNRRRFERDLAMAVTGAEETGKIFSLIVIDVDKFKSINDLHGHAIGDDVLRHVASRLVLAVRGTDAVARIGGDEFVALVSADTDDALASCIDRVRAEVAGEIVLGGRRIEVAVSLGGCVWAPGMCMATLLNASDVAMYEDKRRQRDARLRRMQGAAAPAMHDLQMMDQHDLFGSLASMGQESTTFTRTHSVLATQS